MYEMTWRNKFLTIKAKTVEEMADILEECSMLLRNMAGDGVYLLDDDRVASDYACLVCEDEGVAKKYGLEEEYVEYIGF